MRAVRLRELNIGCFGGGTGLPSLIGGLKQNPWVKVHAVVTMFDSGGSSGQLRDQLGVLPPGDVLRCALALARNEAEARRVLLSRLPALEDGRLGGHPEGDLLDRYASEHKELLPIGEVPEGCEVVTGSFWQGQIARHARRRLAYAVWSVLADRLLSRS